MISKKLFGTLSDGREVDIYELKNANGVSASVITYGATWQSLFAPDRDGNFEDVLIGFDDLKGHVERSDYQGQIVGRYANRICGGHFTVNGKEIDVIKNENGKTCLQTFFGKWPEYTTRECLRHETFDHFSIGDVGVIVKVDFVGKMPDGTLLLSDWKTGRDDDEYESELQMAAWNRVGRTLHESMEREKASSR